MSAIKEARIRCGLCGNRFAPPIAVTTTEGCDELARWGGIVDCPQCHHFVAVSEGNIIYTLDDGSEARVGR